MFLLTAFLSGSLPALNTCAHTLQVYYFIYYYYLLFLFIIIIILCYLFYYYIISTNAVSSPASDCTVLAFVSVPVLSLLDVSWLLTQRGEKSSVNTQREFEQKSGF